MTVRTTESTVTFNNPFKLDSFDRPQPAGTYRLTIDEEEIAGISFLAYRRAVTMLHTPAISAGSRTRQLVPVESWELEAALAKDLRHSQPPSNEEN